MIEAGTVLQNRYRVAKQIGQGGMGAVYVATDERFGSTVAIKETLFTDDNYVRAFEREARLLNSLKHPALPVVSDHFTEKNGQFLVMEYITGEDLAEMMTRNGKPFPLADVLKWADQLLDALEFLHNQETPVIHRDIKPQNLKLNKRGQIILLDFGLAKGSPTDVGSQTAAKSIFGYSLGYASLEQIQGTGTEPRSDLYSLAATLYHLLTGVPPTDALTRAMSVLNEHEDPLKPANAVLDTIPAGVAAVLHRAMALNANHRPASAAAMRSLLSESDKNLGKQGSDKTSEYALPTDIFNQKTTLFGETTTIDQQSENKTQVFSGKSTADASRITKIAQRDFQNTQSDYRGKRLKVGAAVFGGLLVVGTAISAFYISDSQTVAPNNIESVNYESKAPAVNLSAESVNTEASNANSAAAVEEKPEPVEKAASVSSTAKSKTSDKSVAKNSEKSRKNSKSGDKSSTTVVIDEKNDVVTVGNIKLSDKRIETDEYIVDDNRIILKKPPKPGKNIFVHPGLTPEQREKLRNLRNIKPPQPPPPPEN